MSQHPTDRLIRDLIDTRREASTEEVAAIIERMARAPFSAQLGTVPLPLQGATYQGRLLNAREPSLIIHVVQRSEHERQWARGIDAVTYLATLHRAVRLPEARLAVYPRRGGAIAGVLLPTDRALAPTERGTRAEYWFYVVYSADRGMILSGYQASSLATLSIPEEARWLK